MAADGWRRRRMWAVLATTAALGLTVTQAQAANGGRDPFGVRELHRQALLHQQQKGLSAFAKAEDDDDGGEAQEEAEQADQYAEARTSPGIVAPGAYGAAYDALVDLPHTKGSWSDLTRLPYDSDDPRYRDINSNSSGCPLGLT